MPNPVPTITFTVDLTPLMNEDFGPRGNHKSVGVSSPDSANLPTASARRNGFLPGMQLGNKSVKHGDIFVEYGQKAIYLRNTYGKGYAPAERAYLTITSVG